MYEPDQLDQPSHALLMHVRLRYCVSVEQALDDGLYMVLDCCSTQLVAVQDPDQLPQLPHDP